jgi:hypothetical protein
VEGGVSGVVGTCIGDSGGDGGKGRGDEGGDSPLVLSFGSKQTNSEHTWKPLTDYLAFAIFDDNSLERSNNNKYQTLHKK